MNKAVEYANLLRFIAERMDGATRRLQTYEQQQQQIIPLIREALATEDLYTIHYLLQQICMILAIEDKSPQRSQEDQ